MLVVKYTILYEFICSSPGKKWLLTRISSEREEKWFSWEKVERGHVMCLISWPRMWTIVSQLFVVITFPPRAGSHGRSYLTVGVCVLKTHRISIGHIPAAAAYFLWSSLHSATYILRHSQAFIGGGVRSYWTLIPLLCLNNNKSFRYLVSSYFFYGEKVYGRIMGNFTWAKKIFHDQGTANTSN